jgi:hypothetical protein
MRTSTTITQNEVDAYAKFCAEHNIVNDNSQADAANAELVVDYFLNTWKQDITEANLAAAFPQLKQHLKFHSKAETDLRKATISFDEANRKKFAEWFESQTFLVKEGEQGFENAANLMEELKGREVNRETIAAAIGRIEAPTSRFDTRVRRPLHYLQTQRQMSPAAQADAPDRKPGEFISKQGMKRFADGSWGKDYAAERAATAAKNNPTATDSVRLLEAQARQDAENIRGNSRYQDSLLGKTFVTKPGTSDIDWTATAAARRALLRSMVQSASGSVR